MFVKKHHHTYKFCNYYVHDYSDFGKEKFIHDFSLIYWSPLTDSPELVNNNFVYFYSKITFCVESHVPKKRVTRRGMKRRSKPWIGSKVQKLIYFRDKLFNKANKNPTSSNKYLYRKFRNCVVAEQRQSKIKYFQNYF